MSLQVKRSTFLQGSGAAAAMAFFPSRLRAQTLTTINLASTTSDDMTPILYAQQAGIFKKNGLDVQIAHMTNGAAGIQGLTSGTFEFAKGSVTTILAGHEKGVPFTVVGEAFLNNPKAPCSAFMVLKDSPIKTGKDFNGQLVASAGLGDIGTMALSAWVDKNGGDAKTIKFVEIPFSATGAAIEQGRVVAGVASNPQMLIALDGGKVRAIYPVMDSIAPLYNEVAWATMKDYSTKNPGVVKAFVRSYAEAVNYTNNHHAETVQLIAAFTGIDASICARMARVLAWPKVEPSHMQPVIEASVKSGLLKASFPATDVIDVNAR
jgi:NitT/TauT family transport system substrate-binding protein